MNKRSAIAALASALLALLALLCVAAIEMLVVGALLPSGVGWDPVSLWQQSIRGKVVVLVAVGLPVLLPVLAFVFVFTYAYRRISGPAVTPSSMQKPL